MFASFGVGLVADWCGWVGFSGVCCWCGCSFVALIVWLDDLLFISTFCDSFAVLVNCLLVIMLCAGLAHVIAWGLYVLYFCCLFFWFVCLVIGLVCFGFGEPRAYLL